MLFRSDRSRSPAYRPSLPPPAYRVEGVTQAVGMRLAAEAGALRAAVAAALTTANTCCARLGALHRDAQERVGRDRLTDQRTSFAQELVNFKTKCSETAQLMDQSVRAFHAALMEMSQ